jgi:ankyrin repeat protein
MSTTATTFYENTGATTGVDVSYFESDKSFQLFDGQLALIDKIVMLFIKHGANANIIGHKMLAMSEDMKAKFVEGADMPMHAIGADLFAYLDTFLTSLRTNHGVADNLNGQCDKGMTPLHYAAKMNSLSLCMAYMKNGADPTIRDHAGNLARDYATDAAVIACLTTQV